MLRAASIWATLLSSSAHALADDSPTQKVQSAKADAAPDEHTGSVEATPDSNSQLAASAYQQALSSYAHGDLPGALRSMRESYRLSGRAELLYNLAQLEEELKNCDEALAHYGRYLQLVPKGRYRESATEAQGRLEQVCPQPVQAPPPVQAATPPPVNPKQPRSSKEPIAKNAQTGYWTTPRVIGWSAITAGTLSGAVALYFQLEAVRARNEFQQSVNDAEAGGPAVDATLQDRQHRYNNMAIALGIAGGAMVTSGAVVLLLDPGKAGPRSRSASLYALPGLIGVSYAQRF